MSIYNEPSISLRVRYLINILCVPCCDVCYDFRIKMMFRSFFPAVVSNRAYLRYLYLCAYSCVQHICVRVVFFFCVPYVASFSGWYIFFLPLRYCYACYISICILNRCNHGNDLFEIKITRFFCTIYTIG